MFNTRQTLLASRPAAMVLALTLVAALATPFVMLSHARADTTPLPCTEGNHNGCTELSPTPPEDTVSVPPNIMLMLDDSGSMAWDFMPDWGYLGNGHPSGWNSNIKSPGGETVTNPGVRNAAVNGVYYNPDKIYTPPPRADGTLYPDSPSVTGAYNDGFLDTTHTSNVTTYTGGGDGHSYAYYTNLITGYTDYGAPTVNCPSGYSPDPSDPTQCIRAPVAPSTTYKCNSGDTGPTTSPPPAKTPNMCRHRVFTESGPVDTWYNATPVYGCPSGTTLGADNLCHYPTKPATLSCTTGSLSGGTCQSPQTKPFFTYVTGATPSTYVAHFVGAGSNCDLLYNATDKTVCLNEGDPSGLTGPDGKTALAQDGTTLTAGQNIANWFSYNHTRILMAKSGLMTAFSQLGPKYRFGFASINGNGKANVPGTPPYVVFNDAGGGGGDSYNRLAVVQPFGEGSSGCPNLPGASTCTPNSQKDNFWVWIANESANNGTPLRKALQAVGQYYQTDQPWSTMSSDPGYTDGSTTKFACRASYTILTTDGFWNGGDPTAPAAMIGAANTNGPVQSVPAGDLTQYTAVDPFKGGGASATVPSLADVATYYWENDLQPTADMPNEVSPSTKDRAAWQHMTTYTVGLGFDPLYADQTTPIPMDQVFAWAHNVDAGKPVGTTPSPFSWPTPSSNSLNNIADLAHAAVNGHGNFFSAKDPATFAAEFGAILTDIAARNVKPTAAAVNASVLSQGAVSFSTGYNTDDWSGAFEAVTLKPDSTVDQVLWMSGNDPTNSLPSASIPSQLDTAYHVSFSSAGDPGRNVYTDSYDSTKTTPFNVFQFNLTNKGLLDGTQNSVGNGLQSPVLAGALDTLDNRIQYLLGDNTYEDGKTYRTRSSVLGAILRAAPVYVAGATGNYYGSWPTFGGIAPPETAGGVTQTYDDFVTWASTRKGTVYVGANDGMLHAFNAPVPTCTSFDASTGACSSGWDTGTNPGKEDWAFIPRAVYANLGNLTVASNFQFRRTVDATPVTRDVFFSEGGAGNNEWHTILAGGVGLGGRGVYALDITDPTTFQASITSYPASGVLWELDSDMSVSSDCKATFGSCSATDLGFTVSQPNVGRLSNGKWVVLVPNGYFPDCTTPDIPTGTLAQCQAIAAQGPKDSAGNPYSALFVLDAQTGTMLAELKTPTDAGVVSFGLATPVMGDYENDQVDDVAFAGDVQGNLWRFDLTSTVASGWKVTLVYKGNVDPVTGVGLQPITTMPRLFPDPTTNRFMVLFGTGKYLGMGDNNSGNPVQAIYGVRDQGGSATSAMAYSQTDLAPRYLQEASVTMPDGSTATVRCVTGVSTDACDTASSAAAVGATKVGGWFINLRTTTSDGTPNDDGERVVVNPGAIFSSNTVVFETLITGAQSTDPCNPATQGSILALNAVTGGSAGASSLGGGNYAGGRINNARTSGSLPLVSALGGGQAFLPGMTLAPGKNPISIDAPIWRRRSWNEINQNQ